MKFRALPTALLIVTTLVLPWSGGQSCLAGIFDQGSSSFAPSPQTILQQHKPTQVPQTVSLEDILRPVQYPVKYIQAVPLRDLNIPGLDNPALDTLGFNYFVAVDNTPYPDMSSLYRENRLRGKSNFVTVDSIVHPYFAFSNRVLATAIERHITPELSSLLKAMLVVTLADYQTTSDTGIRQDLEHNIAYLGLGIKLLDPKFEIPNKGKSAQLATSELKLINDGAVAASSIFEYDEDYSSFKPQGWYNTFPELQNFYRAQQWVSHMGYPLAEAEMGREASVNNFRRSILLYQSIDKATVNGTPAWFAWKKLHRAWQVLGCFEGYQGNNVILPDRYAAVLKELTPDLKVTMNSLAEPLYRAKLILAMKRQFATGIGTASIAEMAAPEHTVKETQAVFVLLPPSGDPEWPWIKAIAYSYIDQDQGPEVVPISLSCLQAHGEGQADNIILARMGRMHPALVAFLPQLDRLVKYSGSNRPWSILDSYFKFPSEGAQAALRTDTWMSRRAESAFGAWVDSHIAIAPPPVETQGSTSVVAGGSSGAGGNAGKTGTSTGTSTTTSTAQTAGTTKQQGTSTAQTAGSSARASEFTRPKMLTYTQEAQALTRNNIKNGARKQAYFHYLEPAPEAYQAICEDAQSLSRRLGQLGYLSTNDASRFLEFMSLCRRLTRIAIGELKDAALPIADLKLLGNIDKTMGPVDVPLEGIFYASGKETAEGTACGVNMALGHPAQLYVILQLGEKVWLARGALYSYYEIGGGHISALHWQRKQEFSLLRVPFWADKFDVIVQAKNAKTASANDRPRPQPGTRPQTQTPRLPSLGGNNGLIQITKPTPISGTPSNNP